MGGYANDDMKRRFVEYAQGLGVADLAALPNQVVSSRDQFASSHLPHDHHRQCHTRGRMA